MHFVGRRLDCAKLKPANGPFQTATRRHTVHTSVPFQKNATEFKTRRETRSAREAALRQSPRSSVGAANRPPSSMGTRHQYCSPEYRRPAPARRFGQGFKRVDVLVAVR